MIEPRLPAVLALRYIQRVTLVVVMEERYLDILGIGVTRGGVIAGHAIDFSKLPNVSGLPGNRSIRTIDRQIRQALGLSEAGDVIRECPAAPRKQCTRRIIRANGGDCEVEVMRGSDHETPARERKL